VQRKRDLIVTNLLAILVLIGALLAGWWDAAAYGLGVLLFMDLLVVVRERWGRAGHDPGDAEPDLGVDREQPGNGTNTDQATPRRSTLSPAEPGENQK